MEMDSYQDLANAIVIQAAHDYVKALCKKNKYEERLKECERFFTGDDISIFTKLDGKALMERLAKEAEANNYDYRKIFPSVKPELSRKG